MCKMTDEELYSVAVHEAGHVVVANTFCFHIGSIELFRNVANDWSGRAEIIYPTNIFTMATNPVRNAEIALSGFLAQAKALAESTHCESYVFDLNNSIEEIETFFCELVRTSDDCRVLNLPFRKGDSSITQSMSGVHFSDCDKRDFHRWKTDPCQSKSVQALIQEAMQILDDPKNWQQVKELATKLVEQEPTGSNQRRVLASEQISQVLSKDSIQ